MSTTLTVQRLAELTARALERTAFMFAELAEHRTDSPACTDRASCIRFSGPGEGSVILRTTRGFARSLAAGMIGSDLEEVSDAQGDDALRELANVMGGCVISELGGQQCEYSLGLPETITEPHDLGPVIGPGANTCSLDCEGHLLFVTVMTGTHSDRLAASSQRGTR